VNRRELLRGIGTATAASILYACAPPPPPARPAKAQQGTEVRGWLRDAVAKLSTRYPVVHALAVTRRRITAAVDGLGAGVARARIDGVVLVVRDRDGRWREEVGSDLSASGIAALVRALGAAGDRPAKVEFGRALSANTLTGVDPAALSDGQLRGHAEKLLGGPQSSRIVYAAGLVEVDDTSVWSVAAGRDLAQRLVRIRRAATRIAWNGTRPVVGEATVGWRGGVDDHLLDASELVIATRGALELMTPAAFPDGDHVVLLSPQVAAAAVDQITRTLLVAPALRRPEVAARLALGSQATAPAITLVDDPTDPAAYGGFVFDDEGELARPLPLLQAGIVAGRLGDRASAPAIPGGRGLRPGHIGRATASPSHLVITPGDVAAKDLVTDGYHLEGPRSVAVDPSGRITLVVARAREMKGGSPSGRVFADVELTGDLGVLAAMTAVSRDRETVTYRDERDGLPRWRSIDAPWVLSRGLVRGRRT